MKFQETLFPGYTIGEDAYQNIPAVCAPFGKKAAIIGGKRALAAAEEKILLAEYALDFALQASNRALLLAMEAIDAQLAGQEGEKTSP